MSGYRLPTGGRLDRSKNVTFSWDDTRHIGLAGDTVASALMAHGERILSRSFKYHRPRGIMSAGVEESGAVVSLWSGPRRVTNVKASTAEIVEGLEVFGQNAWPSVRSDVGSVNNMLGRFFGAGFYYKTFFGITGRGTWEWMQFEKVIRRAAGMGRASDQPDPDHYEIVHDHCDVLVVGSGPAGLAAANAAADAGLDVILVEQDFELGGSILSGMTSEIDGKPAEEWRSAKVGDLDGKGRIWTRTTAFGLYDHGVMGLLERVTDHMAVSGDLPRERMRIVRAQRIILATGAVERPFAFGNNDTPGVMLASAAATYVNRFGVAPGKRIVLGTNNDSAYHSAMALAGAGIETTILDSREVVPGAAAEAARAAGVTVRPGYVPIEAKGGRGVKALEFGRHRGDVSTAEDRIDCDIVGVAGGWTPVMHIISHKGIKPTWNEELSAFIVTDTGSEPVVLAGSAAGQFTTQSAIRAGEDAGADAAKAINGTKPRSKLPYPTHAWEQPLEPLWEVRDPGRKLKSFIDPQHDVTCDDVRLAHKEGYVSVEHLKRYTTLGMATDQGKMGNVVGLALMAEESGKTIAETGTTTFRPPYTPVSIGAMAGDERGMHWRPMRHSPMRSEHEKLGCKFVDAGFWKRSWYYPQKGEGLAEAAMREAIAVREYCGMVDVSTLGKIMVQGPDAAELLNRVYSNAFAKLPVGKARYGLMLRDDGIVFDDGTTWRLSETDFFMTTTTANAGPVMLHLANLLQTRWPDLKVHITSVSDHWGGVAVAGPKARTVLDGACPDIDFSDDAMPFMGVRQGHMKTVDGEIPVMTARLSFSGEQAWEVMAPADYCPAMFRALLPRIQAERGIPYGLEAMDCLRVEKGHVTGRELDGRTTAADVGLGSMASKKKHYIGRVLAGRPDLVRKDRPTLVGLVPTAPGARFKAGSILFPPGEETGHGLGHVSSIADSPALKAWIGLGFVSGGLEKWEGKTIVARNPIDDQNTEVKVISPHMFDAKGERMHG